MTPLDPGDLDLLATFDTPTICNALEHVDPSRQGHGYTHQPFVCGFPDQKPVVGYARTAAIRSCEPLGLPGDEQKRIRNDYYRYVDAGPKPAIAVIQDLDGDRAGYGAWWGEVQSAIHVGLGARALLTNGSVRDLDQWAPGFQFLAGHVAVSHAYAKPVAFGVEVRVFGMRVRDGDLIHLDRHGAVVIPADRADAIVAAAREVARREAKVLDVARGPGCTAERLIAAFAALDEFH